MYVIALTAERHYIIKQEEFITLSGKHYYIIRQQLYYIIRRLLHYQAVITLIGDYYIIGCNNCHKTIDYTFYWTSVANSLRQ